MMSRNKMAKLQNAKPKMQTPSHHQEIEKKVISCDNRYALTSICGPHDSNAKLLEEKLKLKIEIDPAEFTITMQGSKENIKKAEKFIDYVKQTIGSGEKILQDDIAISLDCIVNNEAFDLSKLKKGKIVISNGNTKSITPKNERQLDYIHAIRNSDLTLGIGPAGTGKTFLAVALAVESLLRHEVEKIILTRPVVEAGENLGFLPGTFEEKLSPYLRPLHDALDDLLGKQAREKYLNDGNIEIVPLAYMRGRTLNNAFIILDEAQNTTQEQMKMFLTRFGYGSKCVVTGDPNQIDLPKKDKSGLVEAMHVLKESSRIKLAEFEGKDVIRHPLVTEVVELYDFYSKNKEKKEPNPYYSQIIVDASSDLSKLSFGRNFS